MIFEPTFMLRSSERTREMRWNEEDTGGREGGGERDFSNHAIKTLYRPTRNLYVSADVCEL